MLDNSVLSNLCDEFRKNNYIDPSDFAKYHVKRGLRNEDGTGVMAGLTAICSVKGYVVDDGERIAVPGELQYRGISIEDIIDGCNEDNRFGFEEVVWLLMFGHLPDEKTLEWFKGVLGDMRELPPYFAEDMIIKAPSKDIMNKLARSVLALYSYDDNPDSTDLANAIRQCLGLIAKLPAIMSYAYQVKRRNFDGKSMYFHPIKAEHSTAECILTLLRPDKQFTDREAKILDRCLMLHADHGGGNNSTFTTRVLSSTGTDSYAALSAAIGSLKGPKHGGANIKVVKMMQDMLECIDDVTDEAQVREYLVKLLNRQAYDKAGLVYGMGHAIYTVSDPRAELIKSMARELADLNGLHREYVLLESVERLTPAVMSELKGRRVEICANVDLYSGLVYRALGIPEDLFTPIFAVARIAGWSAHRIEELAYGGKIMRPAYKSVVERSAYTNLSNR